MKSPVIENYDGGNILFIDTGEYMRVMQFPESANWNGQTLTTTDDTTLQEADDKTGIALRFLPLSSGWRRRTSPTVRFAWPLPTTRRWARVPTCLI